MKNLLIPLIIFACAVCEDFHYERTLLIDYYPHSSTAALTNFLFRGNFPFINGSFAYKELVTAMTSVAQKHNLTLPTKFELIVVSYLSFISGGYWLNLETDFFKSNPSVGKLYNKVLLGSGIIAPPQNHINLIKDVINIYMIITPDNLPDLMTFLRNQLMQTGPVLIYTHCEDGIDRTGEASGSYYMTYLNMTFTEALYINNHVSSRDMHILHRNQMQWYCFYLKLVKGYQHLQCLV